MDDTHDKGEGGDGNVLTASAMFGGLSNAQIGGIVGALVAFMLCVLVVVVVALRMRARNNANDQFVASNPTWHGASAANVDKAPPMQRQTTQQSLNNADGAFVCTDCGKSYPLATDLTIHINLRHK